MNPRLNTTRPAEADCIELTEERELDPVASAQNSTQAIENAQLLWENRAFLGKSLLIGLVVGALIALVIPSRYESTVQLMPPDSQSNSGMAMLAALAAKSAGGAGALAGDLLGIKSSSGPVFIGILRSRTVEDRLVQRFQLKSLYGTKLDEDARKELSQETSVSEDRKSGILTLTVNDHDRHRARAMAAAYVEELNRLAAELSTSAAHRERVFLEERLVKVKQDLDQASRDLGEFSSKNATVDVKEQGRAMVAAAATVQGELIALESQRSGLEAIYTPNNVRVRAAAARAAELRKQLEKLGGSEEDADTEDTALPHSLYPSLRKLPLLGVKYADLYRRAKIEEVVYETLTQQYEIAKVQEAKETPSVKMLDEANLPEGRSFPPRGLITLLCACVVLFVASAWIIVNHRWQRTHRDDPRKQFAQKVLDEMYSSMPWATPNGSRWQAASHKVWIRMTKRQRQSSSTN